MRTYSPKASEITRSWHVVDAEDMVLGRIATEIARVLRGKHKPTFAPHMDTGDFVIVVNADKVVLTSGKAESKLVRHHTGYPGGLKTRTYGELLSTRPEDAIRRTVKGMLPKNRLGAQLLTKLKVYAGPDHPHAAQSPQAMDIPHAPQERFMKPLTQTTGRRKQAVARVRLRPMAGEAGVITVNKRPLADYFPSRTHQMIIAEPLRLTETVDTYDVDATIDGGGITGQAGALRLGIARSLIELDPELRPALKRAGFLARDAREKESKKYGLKKARKAPQYSKR